MAPPNAANTIVQATQAVHGLGVQVILTGIHPQVAQTLIERGVIPDDTSIRGSLRSGIAYTIGRG